MSEHEQPEARARGINDLMIEIVRSPSSGNLLVELAGELIAENARYNMWAYERKARSTTVELWNLAANVDRVHASCASAWEKYVESKDPGAHDGLLDTLRSAIERLRMTRLNDRIDFEDPDMPAELRDWD